MWIKGNDILICDSINNRLLLYRDGKIFDKVNLTNYYVYDCALNGEYYYIIDENARHAYRIDRATKKFEEIVFESNDPEIENDLKRSYSFITEGENIYISGYHYEMETVTYLVNGTTASPVAPLESEYYIRMLAGDYVLGDSNGPKYRLDLPKEKDNTNVNTGLIGGMDSYPEYAYQTVSIHGSEYELYDIYYKFSKSGKIIGRYVQLLSNDTFNPIWNVTWNGAFFDHMVTDDGDLLVVNGDEDHIGIYKVEFGMDEMPERFS